MKILKFLGMICLSVNWHNVNAMVSKADYEVYRALEKHAQSSLEG